MANIKKVKESEQEGANQPDKKARHWTRSSVIPSNFHTHSLFLNIVSVSF